MNNGSSPSVGDVLYGASVGKHTNEVVKFIHVLRVRFRSC